MDHAPEIPDQIFKIPSINNPEHAIAEDAREAAATLEERCIASRFAREDWAMLDAGVARMDLLLGARRGAPVRLPAGADPFAGLPDDDLAADFGAAAGSGDLALDGAPAASQRPTAAPQRPVDATEPLLARLRELVRGEAVAWLPKRPEGGVDADAVRRDVAAVAAAGATVARLTEVVAAARLAGGAPKPWAWAINTLKRNPTTAPASAGGARRAGRARAEVRPDQIDPARIAEVKRKGW